MSLDINFKVRSNYPPNVVRLYRSPSTFVSEQLMPQTGSTIVFHGLSYSTDYILSGITHQGATTSQSFKTIGVPNMVCLSGGTISSLIPNRLIWRGVLNINPSLVGNGNGYVGIYIENKVRSISQSSSVSGISYTQLYYNNTLLANNYIINTNTGGTLNTSIILPIKLGDSVFVEKFMSIGNSNTISDSTITLTGTTSYFNITGTTNANLKLIPTINETIVKKKSFYDYINTYISPTYNLSISVKGVDELGNNINLNPYANLNNIALYYSKNNESYLPLELNYSVTDTYTLIHQITNLLSTDVIKLLFRKYNTGDLIELIPDRDSITSIFCGTDDKNYDNTYSIANFKILGDSSHDLITCNNGYNLSIQFRGLGDDGYNYNSTDTFDLYYSKNGQSYLPLASNIGVTNSYGQIYTIENLSNSDSIYFSLYVSGLNDPISIKLIGYPTFICGIYPTAFTAPNLVQMEVQVDYNNGNRLVRCN